MRFSLARPRLLAPVLAGLVTIIITVPSAFAQGGSGAVIITGLSPDAVGHFDADQCRGCDPQLDTSGACDNSCVSCADTGRTLATSCDEFTTPVPCNAAYIAGGNLGVPISCFFNVQQNVCTACDSTSQLGSLCTNTCLPCADTGRTTLAGKSFLPDGCEQFVGNQSACEQAYVLNSFSNVPLSCFFANGECHSCDVSPRFLGSCTNECTVCDDPTRTSLVDIIGGEGCETLAGDEGACTTSWQFENGYVPTSCFFTAGTEQNQGGFLFIQDGFDRLGPLVTNGKKLAVCLGCNGTTALEGFNAGFDESTLPAAGWTRTTITDPAAIADFLVNQQTPGIDDAGIVYIPSQEADTPHAGIGDVQVAVLNQFKAQLGAFVAGGGGFFALNEASLPGGFEWLDAIVPGAQARIGDTCQQQLELTPPGVTTFPHVDDPLLETLDDHTSGYFIGNFGVLEVLGNGQCRDVTCKAEADTNFLGRATNFFGDICQEETDPATCNLSWQIGGRPAFACQFDVQTTQCRRCGATFEGEPFCPNECQGCDDATRTNFAGQLNEPNCEGVQEPALCAGSWAIGREGLNVSCFFDELAGFCRACETEDEINGECDNTCEPPPGDRAVILGPALASPSPSASATPVPSASASATATATATGTATATATVTPTATGTSTPTATATATVTVVPSPSPTVTAGPPGSLRRFQCYALDRDLVEPIANVRTADVLGSGSGELRRPTRLCAPANVSGRDESAPGDARHLLGWELRDRVPRFAKHKHVTVTDELGTLDVDVIRPVLVMTPTRKSLEQDPGAPEGIGLDHFQCYLVKGATRRVDDLEVIDQFGTLRVDVKRPFRVCVATSKNEEPVADQAAALSCYRVRAEKPRFETVAPVFVHDQFGAREVAVKRPTELCLPATVALNHGND